MAFKDITLQPVLTRKQSPIVVMTRPQVAPDTDLRIKAGWNLDVPNHWEVQFMVVNYIASAAVGNRRLEGYIYNKSNGVISGVSRDSFTTDNITASQNKYLIHRRAQNFSGETDDGDFVQEMLPGSWQFHGDDLLYLYTFGEEAGDLWRVEITFRWLNWELGLADPRDAADPQQPVVQPAKKSWCGLSK